MAVQLDHFIVSARDQSAAAKKLAELLDVPWGEDGPGPFSAVYLNDGLTLDFISTDEAFPVEHFCFRVSDAEFDAILRRIEAAAGGASGRHRHDDSAPRARNGRSSNLSRWRTRRDHACLRDASGARGDLENDS